MQDKKLINIAIMTKINNHPDLKTRIEQPNSGRSKKVSM